MLDLFINLRSRYKNALKIDIVCLALMIVTIFISSTWGTIHKLSSFSSELASLDLTEYISNTEILNKIFSIIGKASGFAVSVYIIVLILISTVIVVLLWIAISVNMIIVACTIISIKKEVDKFTDKQLKKRYLISKIVTIGVLFLFGIPLINVLIFIVPILLDLIVSNSVLLKYTYHLIILTLLAGVSLIAPVICALYERKVKT